MNNEINEDYRYYRQLTKQDLIWLRLAMVDDDLPKPIERPKINIPINRARLGKTQKERDDIDARYKYNSNNYNINN